MSLPLLKAQRTPEQTLIASGLLLLRIVVGGVLLYAGFSKALAPAAEFAAALANYRLFPTALLLPMAWVLPWIEIWVGLFLIAGLYTWTVSRLAAALFTLFLIVLIVAKLRHIDLASCGCFGAESWSPRVTFRMDCILLIVAITVAWMNRKPRRWTLDDALN